MLNTSTRKVINVDKANLIPIYTFKQEDDGLLLLDLYKGSVALDITGQTVSLGVKRAESIQRLKLDLITRQNNYLIVL